MNIKLLGTRVLIKPIDVEEITKGGLIILSNNKDKYLKGTVISIGKGTKDEEMEVSVGDNVLYERNINMEEYIVDDIKYLIMKQSNIAFIID